MAEVVFLDTTIVVDWYGCPRSSMSAEAKLLRERDPSELGLDNYTMQQVRNVLLRSFILARNFVKRYKTIGNATANCDKWVAKAGQSQGGRTRGRIAKNLLMTLQDQYERQNPDISIGSIAQLILGDLDDLIDGELEEQLEYWVAHRTDRTKCVYADGAVEEVDGFVLFDPKPTCQKGKPRSCKIEEFWLQRVKDLKALMDADGAEGNAGKMVEAARSSKAGINSLRGTNCTAHLSDAVIYLSCGSGNLVATTNSADFNFLESTLATDVKVLHIPACGKV